MQLWVSQEPRRCTLTLYVLVTLYWILLLTDGLPHHNDITCAAIMLQRHRLMQPLGFIQMHLNNAVLFGVWSTFCKTGKPTATKFWLHQFEKNCVTNRRGN